MTTFQDDVIYLQKYLEICEQVLGRDYEKASRWGYTEGQVSLAQGLKNLKALNQEFEGKVQPATLKTSLMIRGSLFYPDTMEYSNRCQRAKDQAKKDGLDPDDATLEGAIDQCEDWNCPECTKPSDGWIPSNVC